MAISPAEFLASLNEEERLKLLNSLSDEVKAELKYHWNFWSRPNQLAPLKTPKGLDWNTWLVLAGRGFGKTRMGSEWIREKACGDTPLSRPKSGCERIALVAETAADARDVMVLGDSGILACHPKDFRPDWSPTNRCLTWPNGVKAWVYNATEPDQLRGPQHHCFVSGTTISTPSSDRPVEDIKIGDFVLTRKGPRRVYDARSRLATVITVYFNNGLKLTGTPEHPVLTENGWKSLITLTTEDKICVMNAWNTQVSDGIITACTTNTEVQEVYNEKTETGCTEQSTATTSEKSRPDLTYTTEMRTPGITPWGILNCWNTENTSDIILKSPGEFQNVTGTLRLNSNVSVKIAESSNTENNEIVEVSFVKLVNNDEQTRNVHQEIVYNIAVEDEPEYFANGVLVHNCAWSDELAKYRYAQETWDQLQFGLRLGLHPQALVTTTPRPLPLIKKIMEDEETVVTRGATLDNQANLAANTVKQLYERYGGTRLGRQELEGEILGDIPGALWNRDSIQAARVKDVPDDLERVYVAVDPAVSNNEGSDEHGIVVVGMARDKEGYARGYVLEDGTVRGSPEDWARKAINLYRFWSADKIIAEKNQGGDMVESTLRAVDRTVPVKLVHASRGKVVRAEPISALYEQGRVHHVGTFERLEDQMCAFSIDMMRTNSNGSPDRVDALVWGLTEIFEKITGRRKLSDKEVAESKINKSIVSFPSGNGAWLAR